MDLASKRVIVVGGGLAGMACAVGLAREGVRVTLVESRFALGGRAGSFEDPETGELLDNCQHVLLGCCTNLLDFYERIGAGGKVGFHRRVLFLDGAGRRHDLWGMRGLPAPLHLGLSMAMFSALTVGERFSLVKGMMAMMRMGRAGREKLEGVSFGEWMDSVGMRKSLVPKFLDPVVISALNEETRKGSAKYAIQVFQEAMLAHRRGYLVGLPAVALGELYGGGAGLPGVEVRVNTRVEEVLFETRNAKHETRNGGGEGTEALRHKGTEGGEGTVCAVGVRLRGGEEVRGEAVVVATNHHAVGRWVPEELKKLDVRFGGLERLESVPILGVHLWFDRAVMTGDLYAAALIEGPLQWIFRKDAEGKAVHGVISAAREWVGVAKEEALGRFEKQVRGLFAGARDAKLLRGVIVIEKRATFSPGPGVDALRPGQGPGEGGIGGLFLAGDYTKTDWPATMEGAVRSGYLAGEAVMKGFGVERRLVVGDLRPEWAARVMGMR